MQQFLSLLVLIFIAIAGSSALDNGLALTPPMGWLTWERFRCNTDCVNDPENCIRLGLALIRSTHCALPGLTRSSPVPVSI